jgi:hypothetical protein
MPCLAAVCRTLGHRATRRPRGWLATLVLWLALGVSGLAAPAAWAQGVELLELHTARDEAAVSLDYQVRLTLPPGVEAAVLRGVPIYFRAQASLWRSRWYWRDDRIARATREWRLSFQPLTSSWRISQGGLGQSFASLAEALAAITRSSGWRIAEARDVDPESRHYVEFSWRLDTTQLPRPMQIGLSGISGASEWSLGVERSVRLSADAGK